MRKFCLIWLLMVTVLPSFSQMESQDRMNLQNLLAERAKNFSAYTSNIQKRSGIFGNRTKGDIQKTNEILIDIVTLDNDIMDALHRALSYKTFEKATDNYSSRDCEMKLKQSMLVTDTLMKQLAMMEKKTKRQGSSDTIYKILFFLSAITCVILAFRLRQKTA